MRFERQISIKDIGTKGQAMFANAHVLVIGAGGLGSPVFNYLAAAGIGKISIVDGDLVSLSNLNRQFFYGINDVGQSKVIICAKKLSEQYADVKIVAHNEYITQENVEKIASDVSVIVDCVDSTPTRLMLNDFAVKNNIPLVEGSMDGLYGFCLSIVDGACLRCAGIENNNAHKEWSALGTTAGIIGTLQAQMCIKILLGQAQDLSGRIIHYDGNRLEFDEVLVNKNPKCICSAH